MTTFNFPLHTIAYAICFFIYISFEIAVRYYKKQLQKNYQKKKGSIHSFEEAEKVSLDYFNRLQVVDVSRIVVSLFLIIVVLSIADVRTFSFLAVTVGAIIITLRDYILSLISYIYVIANFDIGDDVRIALVLGEVVSVRPLTTSIAGKDEHGDFDGRLHHIPNSKFITEIVERQEIKNNTYRRITLQVLYSNEIFTCDFSLWLGSLKKYLNEVLPKRSLKDVGNYKSYAGMQYKLHYDYDEDGDIVVTISFISRTKDAVRRKEEIIEYVETTKRVILQKENVMDKKTL